MSTNLYCTQYLDSNALFDAVRDEYFSGNAGRGVDSWTETRSATDTRTDPLLMDTIMKNKIKLVTAIKIQWIC